MRQDLTGVGAIRSSITRLLVVGLALASVWACADSATGPPPRSTAAADESFDGTFAQLVLLCIHWTWGQQAEIWICTQPGDTIQFELCQNGEEPPECIEEEALEPPNWSPSDTIGGNPPGSGDGIPDPPDCDDDDPICEGTAPPELVCPSSVVFGETAQCQLNLHGNAVAGTEWEISGPDFSSRTSGGDDVVQQYWSGRVVAPFEVKVDVWLFDGGNNPIHWTRLESGSISVTRSEGTPWSSTNDWSVVEDTLPPTPCSGVTAEPATGYLGLTYSRLSGCGDDRWISPAYWQGEGIQTDSVTGGWQDGLHYVVSSSYHIELETAINPHLDPSFSAAQHPVDPADFGGLCPDASFTFYQVNDMCGDPDFDDLRAAVVTHERRHATRVQERMSLSDYDPRRRVWRLVADSRSALLLLAEDEVESADALLFGYSDALDDAQYEQNPLWEGGLWHWWNGSPGFWVLVPDSKVSWDGGAP